MSPRTLSFIESWLFYVIFLVYYSSVLIFIVLFFSQWVLNQKIWSLGLVLKGKLSTTKLSIQISLNWHRPVFDSQRSKDWTVSLVFCRLSPVWLWSFCSPVTRLSNTTNVAPIHVMDQLNWLPVFRVYLDCLYMFTYIPLQLVHALSFPYVYMWHFYSRLSNPNLMMTHMQMKTKMCLTSPAPSGTINIIYMPMLQQIISFIILVGMPFWVITVRGHFYWPTSLTEYLCPTTLDTFHPRNTLYVPPHCW